MEGKKRLQKQLHQLPKAPVCLSDSAQVPPASNLFLGRKQAIWGVQAAGDK